MFCAALYKTSLGLTSPQSFPVRKGEDLVRRSRLGSTAEVQSDANDGKHWSEMDVRNLMASLRCGDTIEEAAERLCRSGTVDEVRRKAEELGLKYKSSG